MLVAAPLAGTVLALADVPDPVFATAMLGPGAAVLPDDDGGAGSVDVLAPVPGVLGPVHPHAFVITTAAGPRVLVHLGIDTVGLRGEGFEVLRTAGEAVAAGDRIVSWSPSRVAALGYSPVCPVVVLDAGGVDLLAAAGAHVPSGAPLLEVAEV